MCTLRAAIQESNALAGAQTIFLPGGTYKLTIPGTDEDGSATGDLDITDDLTIGGALIVDGGAEPGSAIDAAGLDRAVEIVGPIRAELLGVVIANGNVTAYASGLLSLSGVVKISNSAVKGNTGHTAVWNGGTMNFTGVTLTDNLDAIYNQAGGTLTLDSVGVTRNSSYVGPTILNNGSMTIERSTLTENTGGFAGAIANHGTMAMVDTTIADNKSRSLAGAMEPALGDSTLTNVTISGNEAKGSGGAIFVDAEPRVTIINSTISSNRAVEDFGPFGRIPGAGGAIAARSGTFSLINTTVAGNTADDFGAAFYSVEPGPQSSFENPVVALTNTLVARNTVDGAAANCTGTVVPLKSNGHNIEDANTCGFTGTGDIVSVDAKLGPLAGPYRRYGSDAE